MDRLFTLRVRLSQGYATIHAFDGGKLDNEPRLGVGADRIEVVVRHMGKTVFPLGQLYCGTPACGEGWALDGPRVRELALSLVSMRPHDADDEYFADYSPEQLAWAERFDEEIFCEREARYPQE